MRLNRIASSLTPRPYKYLMLTICAAAVGVIPILLPDRAASDYMPNADISSVASGSWSDPGIWDRGRVPTEGDYVYIGESTSVTYDVWSEDEIAGMTIDGDLRFARSHSTNLDVGTVTVNPSGLLEIGSAWKPMPLAVTATIRIVNAKDGENSIEVMGEMRIHGSPLQFVYTDLATDAEPGSRVITTRDSTGWRAGDRLAIASTSLRPQDAEQTIVETVRGRLITLERPLKHWHSGSGTTAAEVANLTRNVVITSKSARKRGHTRFLSGARAYISYAEFANLGPQGQLGKYPIHFHMVGDSMRGSYVKGASIWNSGNRFITVHSTSNITLSDNVGYGAVGHGFFMESGDEVFVTWERNLGMLVRPGKILGSDATPAIFWSENPANSWVGNIAVSSVKGYGFNIRVPNRGMDIALLGGATQLRELSVVRFDNNEAHSNGLSGLRMYRLNSKMGKGVTNIVGFTSWRNGEYGARINAVGARLESSLIFGNKKANVHLSGRANVIASTLILGERGFVPKTKGVKIQRSLNGVLLAGTDNTIVDSVISGHASGKYGDVGADIRLVQDAGGAVTATVRNTLMRSERPMIFGYPMNNASVVKFEDYQRISGNDFRLIRLDASPPPNCTPSVDLRFIANVCASN